MRNDAACSFEAGNRLSILQATWTLDSDGWYIQNLIESDWSYELGNFIVLFISSYLTSATIYEANPRVFVRFPNHSLFVTHIGRTLSSTCSRLNPFGQKKQTGQILVVMIAKSLIDEDWSDYGLQRFLGNNERFISPLAVGPFPLPVPCRIRKMGKDSMLPVSLLAK
jgi:hypothetical protein